MSRWRVPGRRTRWLVAAAAVVVLAVAAGVVVLGGRWGTGGGAPIRVGVLHSLTGSVAISERPINDTTLMAIDEINAAGGLLGRRVEPVVVDGKSDWPTFAAETERLIQGERVAAIFGCYTSASRRTIVPIVEKHRNLLLYPTYYEGIESSPNVVYTGATANQYIIPAVKWFMENRGKSFYLVGSDYIFPRAVNEIVKDQVRYLGGQIVGEEYVPLGSTDVAGVVKRINAAQPQAILSTVVGDTNISFFQGLRSAGITPRKIPSLSLAIGEAELRSLNPKEMAGDYVAMSYFQSIPSPENERFVSKVRAKYGADSAVSDPMEAAYVSVHLWAQAVRDAGSVEVDAVLRAIRGQHFAGPGGDVYLDEENLHTWKAARIGEIRPDGQVDIVWTSETVIHPVPYSVYRTKRAWDEAVHALYVGWGNSWARP